MPAHNRLRSFEALDSCHRQIHVHLDELGALVDQVARDNLDYAARKCAKNIEIFFSTAARGHHAEEEEHVFPCLLIGDDHATVAKVRELIEDHFWIEKYWLNLAPLLRAIGSGANDTDAAHFAQAVKLFHDLSSYHIESEESMIYPQAKATLCGTYPRPVLG